MRETIRRCEKERIEFTNGIGRLARVYEVKITCDNCQVRLKDGGQNKFSGEEDSFSDRISLRLSAKTSGDLIDLDLCPACAGLYLKVLRKPMAV